MRITTSGPAVLAASSLLFLAACGSADDGAAAASGAGSGSGSDGVSVVASTNVYGDIASVVGGDDVQVTSIVDDPSADPHSFEASTRDQLTVSEADVVVGNGGGYDDWLDTLVSASETQAVVVDATDVSGREADAEAAGEELNEHIWYDPASIDLVVGRLVEALSEVDPDNADTYAANGDDYTAQLREIVDAQEQARATVAGAGVAVTEPLPGYLLDAIGAENRTPEEFSEAIEEGDDVSPAVLQEVLDLFTSGQVQALVYNEQTTGPETERVLQAAEDAGVAVVPLSETLPEGEDYLSWMRGNVDAVAAALSA